MARRWLALAAYTAAIYGFLPLGPRVGLAVGRTALGGWLLGPGILVLTVAGTAALGLVLARRAAPLRAYAMLVGAGLGYVLAFSWLSVQHLERTHLHEYGIVAVLAPPSSPGIQGPAARMRVSHSTVPRLVESRTALPLVAHPAIGVSARSSAPARTASSSAPAMQPSGSRNPARGSKIPTSCCAG